MKRKIGILFAYLVIVFFVFFPETVCQGAKTGLLLWFQTVLPALLPFMIVSVFFVKKNITDSINKMAAPFFTEMFHISRPASYPALIGMLSGYPIGAKTVAQMYEEKQLDKAEAQYLLCFCNNASPMFLIEFIGVECMHLSFPITVLVLIYTAGYLGSLIERHTMKKRSIKNAIPRHNNDGKQKKQKESPSLVEALDECILDSFVTITKVGGYIILFSIFAKIVADWLPFSAIIKWIMIGLLEITTGASMIAHAPLAECIKDAALVSLCAFGGFSGAAQTASVISNTDLSVRRYLYVKFRQAVIAGILALILFFIL